MALTVAQLKEILNHSDVNDAMIVVLSSDAEGNRYAPVPEDTDETTWSHSLGYYDAEDETFTSPPAEGTANKEELSTWEWLVENGQLAICLWPS